MSPTTHDLAVGEELPPFTDKPLTVTDFVRLPDAEDARHRDFGGCEGSEDACLTENVVSRVQQITYGWPPQHPTTLCGIGNHVRQVGLTDADSLKLQRWCGVAQNGAQPACQAGMIHPRHHAR